MTSFTAGDDSAQQKTAEIIGYVNNGDIDGVRRLLAEGVNVDCQDSSGMTPLQHAAYKGDLDICDLLLKNGANVNANYHHHGYTALMFAALAGSKKVVKFLLEHGASTTMENSVHRTASQMAGFVGQHEIVTLISNFFSQDEIDYYCLARGTEKEPKLPRHLSSPVYKFCTTISLNPIKLVFLLQSMPEILNSSTKVLKVLELLCEKMMKRRETDEVMALRFHYLFTVLTEAVKFNKEHNDNLESYVKHLIKGRLSDGFPVNQEILVRETLRTFPYPECQLMHQAVRSIASTNSSGNATAISVLQSAINGQRMASDEDKQCSTCGEYNGKACNSCHSVYYCDRQCQKIHWHLHKRFCKELALQHEKKELMKKMEEEGGKNYHFKKSCGDHIHAGSSTDGDVGDKNNNDVSKNGDVEISSVDGGKHDVEVVETCHDDNDSNDDINKVNHNISSLRIDDVKVESGLVHDETVSNVN